MKPERRTGDEPFIGHSEQDSFTLKDFWAWSSSDVLSNRMRGIVAEFIVAQALGVAAGKFRVEWDACDVRSANGIHVEVKSAAYCQAWQQKELSKIVFSIRPSTAWDSTTNAYADGPALNAHVYIFALLHNQDKDNINVLDLTHWEFHVVPAPVIKEKCAGRKTIGLAGLKALGAEPVGYDRLRSAIELAYHHYPTLQSPDKSESTE